MMRLLNALVLSVLALSVMHGTSKATDGRDMQQGLSDREAVYAYASNFLTKMLTELNAGPPKTVNHVRVHLLPYLGGLPTLDALKTDSVNDPACTVCYQDEGTSRGLLGLREQLPDATIQAYDAAGVCYALLTERIMQALPQSADGVWLKPDPNYAGDAEGQVRAMLDALFEDSGYSANSCPVIEEGCMAM